MLYVPETGSDSELSWEHSSGHAKESVRDAEKDVKDLKGNKILSTEAKNILSDLELDTDDESGGSLLHYGTRAPGHRTSSISQGLEGTLGGQKFDLRGRTYT